MIVKWWRTAGIGARAGGVITAVMLLAAILAPLLAPHDPLAISDPVRNQLLPPGNGHLLGTDAFSRDVWSRLVYGARVSLFVGIGAAAIATLIGAAVGFAAGLGSAFTDGVLMRIVDVLLALPRLFLLIGAFALREEMPLGSIVLLIALTGWFETSRLVRAHVRELRGADYVTAAVALGGGRRSVARHLLPHVGATLLVSATMDIGAIILLEAALSFLGLGVRLPQPSWGNMILEGRSLLISAPWVALAPGVALTITAVGFNLLGDGLRDALDPAAAARRGRAA